MRYFPIFVDLAGRDVLIVGGGEQALQKARLVLKSQARLIVIATEVVDAVQQLADTDSLVLQRRDFTPADIAGKALVFAATGNAEQNAAIAAAARAAGVPVNAVDEPQHSSFIMPAIVDRDPVVVAIGTEGTAPVMAREIKARLEAWLPSRFGAIAAAAGRLRERIAAEISDATERRRFWQRLLKGPFRQAALADDTTAQEQAVAAALQVTRHDAGKAGRIVLIGCGPGDPDLLTLKAQQALQEADVLVVDRLVPEAILEYARRDAERIDVGKTPGGPSTSQEAINRILVREGLKGKVVARLKGGDAFVFGRAAEEMAAARAAGLAVDVIPGITAAHACAARIGLPLTLRQRVRKFSVLTGATAEGEAEHDWQALVGKGQAFAIYMGITSSPVLQHKLLAAGADPATTVVIVENGTLPQERVIETTLGALAEAVRHERLKGPAIIFVGLDWNEAQLSRPAHVVRFAGAPASPSWTPAEVALATHWVAG